MELNSANFIELWKVFTTKYVIPEKLSNWENNKDWTNIILTKELVNEIKEKFNLESWYEYRKFDLTILGEKKFNNIKSFASNNEILNLDYSTIIRALIEHENNYLLAYEEMIKLVYEHAQLKVLVTYPDKEEDNEVLVENFSSIISQSNNDFKQNNNTEYLLITGIKRNKIYWSFYTINFNGLLINKIS